MVRIDLFQRHVGTAVLHRSDKAPPLALGFQLLTTLLEVGVECGQLLPELIDRTIEELVGHEEMLFDILLFHFITSFAGQDDQFANHVRSTEINTWVGFRVALLLGTAHRFRERHVGSYLVEDEVEGA